MIFSGLLSCVFLCCLPKPLLSGLGKQSNSVIALSVSEYLRVTIPHFHGEAGLHRRFRTLSSISGVFQQRNCVSGFKEALDLSLCEFACSSLVLLTAYVLGTAGLEIGAVGWCDHISTSGPYVTSRGLRLYQGERKRGIG